MLQKALSRGLVLFAAALIALGGYGCGDDDEEEAQAPVGEARVRAIHLSPDAPAVDIYVNGTPPAAIEDLAFGESTPFVDADAGSYTFNVTAAGAPPPPPSVLDIGPLQFQANKAYTAVAFNELDAPIEALLLEDDLSSTGTGNIRLRAIHVAPDVGEVDIWNITDPEDPTPLYTNVNFGDAGAYLVVPAATYTLGFDVNNDAVPDLAFETGPLPAGSIVNVFAVNQGSDVFLIAQFLDGTTVRIDPAPARVRVIHLSPTAPGVDVFVNSTPPPAVTDLAFKEGTGYLELDAGTYTFNVVPNGGTPADSVLDVGPLDLLGGAHYTAAAVNLLLAPIEALAMEDNNSDPGSGNIRVRAIHTAPGVGEVDIWEVSDLLNPILLYENVNFRDIGEYLILPAGAYTLGFDVDNDAVPDLTFSTPAIPAGSIVNIFAVNQVADVFLLAQFQDGTVAQIDPL
jgi:hypothetical protein